MVTLSISTTIVSFVALFELSRPPIVSVWVPEASCGVVNVNRPDVVVGVAVSQRRVRY
jgi:hypothetical protein